MQREKETENGNVKKPEREKEPTNGNVYIKIQYRISQHCVAKGFSWLT
jgi:hypothetical protein